MPATAQHRPPLLTAGPQRQASCSTMLGSLSKGQRSGSRAVTCFLSDTGVDEAIRRAGFSGHPRFGGLPAWWPVVLAGASRRPSRPRDFQSRGPGCRVPWRRSSRSPSLVACLPTSGRNFCMTHWGGIASPSPSCADVGGRIASGCKFRAHPRLSSRIHSRNEEHSRGSACGQVADKGPSGKQEAVPGSLREPPLTCTFTL